MLFTNSFFIIADQYLIMKILVLTVVEPLENGSYCLVDGH